MCRLLHRLLSRSTENKRMIGRAAARGETLGHDLNIVAGTSLDKGA